jgi:Cellulase (glycosyl hydrolase family 5)
MTRGRIVLAFAAVFLAVLALIAVVATRFGSPAGSVRYRGTHEIAVRGRQLVDRRTGLPFVARGWNYVRLGAQMTPAGRIVYHSTFNLGRYEPARAERALRLMHTSGYDVVRVFLDAACFRACLVDPQTGELSPAYVSNVADFLRRAAAANVEVMLTIDYPPDRGRYGELLQAEAGSQTDGVNRFYLTPGGIRASAAFWSDLVSALARRDAPLRDVVGYELLNEVTFANRRRPLTLRAGTFTSPAGRRYRLASTAERTRLLADGLVYWLDTVRRAIRDVDPTALVGVGFAQPLEQRSIGPSLVRAVLERSQADFVDVHAYSSLGLPWRVYAAQAGFAASRKPLLMGELGAFRATYPTVADAEWALRSRIEESCGYGFSGWLAWSWDTRDQPELWNATSAGGALERALAPAAWPSPCSHG